jgi:hypothetical protein
MEEDLLPAMEQFLVRTGEIDAVREAAHGAGVKRLQAATAARASGLGIPA